MKIYYVSLTVCLYSKDGIYQKYASINFLWTPWGDGHSHNYLECNLFKTHTPVCCIGKHVKLVKLMIIALTRIYIQVGFGYILLNQIRLFISCLDMSWLTIIWKCLARKNWLYIYPVVLVPHNETISQSWIYWDLYQPIYRQHKHATYQQVIPIYAGTHTFRYIHK